MALTAAQMQEQKKQADRDRENGKVCGRSAPVVEGTQGRVAEWPAVADVHRVDAWQMEAHDREESGPEIRWTVLAEDQNVRWNVSFVHAVSGEDETERELGLDGAGGCYVASSLYHSRALAGTRMSERRLCTDRESDEHEEREQEPAHAISV